MGKRDDFIYIIGTSAKLLQPKISPEDIQRIQKEHDIAIEDKSGGLQALDMWDTDEMYSYENVVRIIGEDYGLSDLINPILDKLEK
jgi:hypothetical protein